MTKIQQFHLNSKTAKEYVNKSINEPHGMLARDFQGMKATSARLAKRVDKKTSNVPVNGRRLYNITLVKRKK